MGTNPHLGFLQDGWSLRSGTSSGVENTACDKEKHSGHGTQSKVLQGGLPAGLGRVGKAGRPGMNRAAGGGPAGRDDDARKACSQAHGTPAVVKCKSVTNFHQRHR